MSKTIELTQDQYDALQNGESITINPPKKKWEPEGGKWVISGIGKASDSMSWADGCTTFGVTRKTKAQAEKAAEAMRIHNRLLAYVDEHAPDWVADWDDSIQTKWYVYKFKNIYHASSMLVNNLIGVVYMPLHVAEDLVKKLNSGEVVL